MEEQGENGNHKQTQYDFNVKYYPSYTENVFLFYVYVYEYEYMPLSMYVHHMCTVPKEAIREH